MKKLFIILLLCAVLFSCTMIEPGNVGLKVYLRGSHRGEIETLEPGQYADGYDWNFYSFPTFKQNYVWTQSKTEGSPTDESFTFPVDGMSINIDVGIEYSIAKEYAKQIFESYRLGVNELTDITIRNKVRDYINIRAAEYNIDSLVEGGAGKLLKSVQEDLENYFKPQGIIIHSLSLVSAPRYPESVKVAIEEKVKATQKAVQSENELREANAEAEKKKAEAAGEAARIIAIAEAEAKANYLKSNSLTQNIIKMEWVKKWDGKLPEVTSDSSMMINLGN